jgi:hypothetical protein
MRTTLGLIALMAVISGCGSKQVKLSDSNKVTTKGIAMWATWVKDKGKKYDMQLNIANENEKAAIILLYDMTCYRGETPGRFKHTFFGMGERTINFGSGQTKNFTMVCDDLGKATGDIKIKVRKVYENPNGDGITQGKVLAENLEWKNPSVTQ